MGRRARGGSAPAAPAPAAPAAAAAAAASVNKKAKEEEFALLYQTAPASPEHHAVTQSVLDQLNERQQCFVSRSVYLFQVAWQGYMEMGRGVLLVSYANVEEIATSLKVRAKYTELTEMMRYNYEPVNDLMKVYNPRDSFVLGIAVNFKDGCVLAATIVMRTAQYTALAEELAADIKAAAAAATALPIFDATEKHAVVVPMPVPVPTSPVHAAVPRAAGAAAGGTRFCCAVRAAVGLSGPCPSHTL